nr:DDE-type integrase/transposase/recombinase [Sneathiella litorea]
MKRYALGGTGSVLYLLQKLERLDQLQREKYYNGNGIWTKYSSGSIGEIHYLWRAVDQEGEVLEAYVTKKRDRKAALKFLKKAMKRYGRPRPIVTDKLRSYCAAMKIIGNEARQDTGRWLNNRAENSHQPFRRRERAMIKFRSTKSLQKFVSIHSSIQNHFNQERHLINRKDFELKRKLALVEWRQLAA